MEETDRHTQTTPPRSLVGRLTLFRSCCVVFHLTALVLCTCVHTYIHLCVCVLVHRVCDTSSLLVILNQKSASLCLEHGAMSVSFCVLPRLVELYLCLGVRRPGRPGVCLRQTSCCPHFLPASAHLSLSLVPTACGRCQRLPPGAEEPQRKAGGRDERAEVEERRDGEGEGRGRERERSDAALH